MRDFGGFFDDKFIVVNADGSDIINYSVYTGIDDLEVYDVLYDYACENELFNGNVFVRSITDGELYAYQPDLDGYLNVWEAVWLLNSDLDEYLDSELYDFYENWCFEHDEYMVM